MSSFWSRAQAKFNSWNCLQVLYGQWPENSFGSWVASLKVDGSRGQSLALLWIFGARPVSAFSLRPLQKHDLFFSDGGQTVCSFSPAMFILFASFFPFNHQFKHIDQCLHALCLVVVSVTFSFSVSLLPHWSSASFCSKKQLNMMTTFSGLVTAWPHPCTCWRMAFA